MVVVAYRVYDSALPSRDPGFGLFRCLREIFVRFDPKSHCIKSIPRFDSRKQNPASASGTSISGMAKHDRLAKNISSQFVAVSCRFCIDKLRLVPYITPPIDAGWSSLVARRAHNPKVVGSNPAPATNRVTAVNPWINRGFFWLFEAPGPNWALQTTKFDNKKATGSYFGIFAPLNRPAVLKL